jgi:hypothetical protein
MNGLLRHLMALCAAEREWFIVAKIMKEKVFVRNWVLTSSVLQFATLCVLIECNMSACTVALITTDHVQGSEKAEDYAKGISN